MVHAGPGRQWRTGGFAIVIGDDTQVQKDVPAAAQPEERAAGDVQVQTTPTACLLYTSDAADE